MYERKNRIISRWLIILIILMTAVFIVSAFAERGKANQYDVQSLYISKYETPYALELVDSMLVNLEWDKLSEHDVIDAELKFPEVPEELALVVLTDGFNIVHGQWDLTSFHSLHAYFWTDDLLQLNGKNGLYLLLLKYADARYFYIY